MGEGSERQAVPMGQRALPGAFLRIRSSDHLGNYGEDHEKYSPAD